MGGRFYLVDTMQPVVQCVPNFSEGRRPEVVESIVDAARNASSAHLIDYSSDADHNRMVITFLAPPGEIRDAVFAAAQQAVELIDMRAHTGVHPRIGAVDVVPVVPVAGITMDECIDLSYQIGNDIAHHLAVPVYFYEQSAKLSHRRNLADVRRGGYERLCALGMHGDRAPDLGPQHVHHTAGATVVGARGPLIAFNINLATTNLEVAKEIAGRIRSGEANLIGVKSIGVPLESASKVQVSMNITRPDLISLHSIYTFVQEAAGRFEIEIAESEIIGAVSERFLDGTSVQELKVAEFSGNQIIENWL
jgi:glutamate formiminotransferase / 5-formyltetrahydrofolate cyclo-ligase